MTQQTDPTVPANEEKRPVPAWMGIVVVLLCLIGGGGFLYWYLHDPLSSGEAVADPDRTVAPNPRPTRNVVRSSRVTEQVAVDGVKVASETARATTYMVRAGNNVMDVEKPKSGEPTYTFRYTRRDLLTPEQRELAMVRFRVMQDQAVASALGITADQQLQLRKIPTTITMEVSSDDRQKLIDLFKTWDDASDGDSKSKADKEIIAALNDVGNRSFDATKAKIQERVDQITAILTPEHIKKFNNMGNPAATPPPAPAATPATKAAAVQSGAGTLTITGNNTAFVSTTQPVRVSGTVSAGTLVLNNGNNIQLSGVKIVTDEKQKRILCASNMRQIGQAMLLYANENRGKYPATLEDLLKAQEILASNVFCCPSTKDTPAPGATNAEKASKLNAGDHLSYVYLGKGKTYSASPDTVTLYEALDHHSEGANFLYADGHVEFLDTAAATKAIEQLKAGQNPPNLK